MERAKKLASQLGKVIPDAGAHMPHVVVGVLRRKRQSKKEGFNERRVGGGRISPMKSDPPWPMDFLPGSM